jgi:hypothetical protein
LERVVGPFASQVCAGSPLQFAVDERHEVVARLQVAAAPSLEHAADCAGLTRCLVH